METTRGNVYTLDDAGNVVARSNGPKGWDYSGKWTILGASKRYHSRLVASLATIAAEGIPGHGVIHDYDHGYYRVWGNERMRSLVKVSA
jgi:hypothetical protein